MRQGSELREQVDEPIIAVGTWVQPRRLLGVWCTNTLYIALTAPQPQAGEGRGWMLHRSSSPALVEGREPQRPGREVLACSGAWVLGPRVCPVTVTPGRSCCCAQCAQPRPPASCLRGEESREEAACYYATHGLPMADKLFGWRPRPMSCAHCRWPKCSWLSGLDLEAVSSELLSWEHQGLSSWLHSLAGTPQERRAGPPEPTLSVRFSGTGS